MVSNLTYFAALASMPLAEASAIFFVAPLLITASSAILLREHAGVWRWSALAYAAVHTMTRQMGLDESAATMAVYIQITFIASCLAMGVAFGDGRLAGSGHPALEFLFRAWAWPGPMDFALFLLAGVSSALGGYLISQAYRSSAASLVAPFEYSALVLAAFWGFVIWGEVPGPVSAIGIVLILSSGVLMALREARRSAA